MEKSNIAFEEKSTIMLSYDWNTENPISLLAYLGNEKHEPLTFAFRSEKYQKESIKLYWESILELEKRKNLNLDTLCKTIENVFSNEERFTKADKLKLEQLRERKN